VTNVQTSIFDQFEDTEALEARLERRLTPLEQFSFFHVRNPHVFEALERMAGEMASRGRKRIGVKMLVEVLRYEYYLETSDPNSEFKVSNNYTALYARLLIDTHPEWAELIETRERHHG
jgi:hypothetical protein